MASDRARRAGNGAAPYRMATINDVARKAGVSVATVSYVLNGKDRVSAQSERRVKRAIEALHYTPSGTARKLKLGRSSIIGFVADNIANRFPAHLVQGLANAAAAQGYAVLISDLHDDPPGRTPRVGPAGP